MSGILRLESRVCASVLSGEGGSSRWCGLGSTIWSSASWVAIVHYLAENGFGLSNRHIFSLSGLGRGSEDLMTSDFFRSASPALIKLFLPVYKQFGIDSFFDSLPHRSPLMADNTLGVGSTLSWHFYSIVWLVRWGWLPPSLKKNEWGYSIKTSFDVQLY